MFCLWRFLPVKRPPGVAVSVSVNLKTVKIYCAAAGMPRNDNTFYFILEVISCQKRKWLRSH
jgi:hypothetical protein